MRRPPRHVRALRPGSRLVRRCSSGPRLEPRLAVSLAPPQVPAQRLPVWRPQPPHRSVRRRRADSLPPHRQPPHRSVRRRRADSLPPHRQPPHRSVRRRRAYSIPAHRQPPHRSVRRRRADSLPAHPQHPAVLARRAVRPPFLTDQLVPRSPLLPDRKRACPPDRPHSGRRVRRCSHRLRLQSRCRNRSSRTR
jgi:hypothetical protein